MKILTSSSSSVQKTESKISPRRIFLVILYFISLLILTALLIEAYEFYSTPNSERPHHSDYRQFRPAGDRGLLYGYIGTVMMVLMLLYTVRKRTGILGRKIPMRPFLDFHIFMGVLGPLFIILHTSFKIQGLVAVSFWSMVAVALSGFLGRYLYQKIPRNFENRELTINEIDRIVSQMMDDLNNFDHLEQSDINEIVRVYENAFDEWENSESISLYRILKSDIRRPWIIARLKRQLVEKYNIPGDNIKALLGLASQRALLKHRMTILAKVRHFFHYWHVIHKPFAIIMYIIMIVHIGIAIWTGYGWF